ncbi:MAG TPA: Spy/CpxP family protein refolding chaperone, partial [Pyrinomonadaceae bacterium]|nr:Spy/CpxP family protein refolding chaperone [Pyrinomonadaceae bacterium]
MKRFIGGVALTLALSATAFAQQTPAPEQPQTHPENPVRHRRMGRAHGPRMARHLRARRGLRRLELSDAQRQQFRSLRDSHRQRTQAQRAELRQLLRTRRQGGTLNAEQEARARQLQQELRQTGQSVHGEMLGVLTPEQRTRLEQQ